MRIYTQEEARERINRLAAEDKSFVFVISYDMTKAIVEETAHIDTREMMYAFPHLNNIPRDATADSTPPEWSTDAPDRSRYARSIDIVKRNIMAGNSYLVNLTCKVPVHTNLGLRDIFLRSKARYRCWVKDRFVCFSPETFVTIDRGEIRAFPMKGTIDAAIPHAEQRLAANIKEAAEHATIVDLLRNDLSRVAEGVTVRRYRYVDRVTTHRGELLQTSSKIAGHVLPAYGSRLGDLLFRLLPAGSITGAPKPETMNIIAEAEGYDRGFYTGVMGCHVHGRVDSAVMIRFIDREDGRLYYKAGGGITARSDNEDEYQEVIAKVYVPIY